jgi:hypothetical protein
MSESTKYHRDTPCLGWAGEHLRKGAFFCLSHTTGPTPLTLHLQIAPSISMFFSWSVPWKKVSKKFA